MMKKVMAIVAAIVILAALLCACGSESVSGMQASGTPTLPCISAPAVSPSPSADVKVLKDGTYEYIGEKDAERYHVEGTMVISGGVIQSMEWKIVDDNRNRIFDETYEEVFTGNEVYIQQSRDNWSGMQTFVPALLNTQDPNEVDSVSGATWAYKKFKEAAKALLAQASE